MSTGRLIITTGDLQTQQVIACNSILTTPGTNSRLQLIFTVRALLVTCQALSLSTFQSLLYIFKYIFKVIFSHSLKKFLY